MISVQRMDLKWQIKTKNLLLPHNFRLIPSCNRTLSGVKRNLPALTDMIRPHRHVSEAWQSPSHAHGGKQAVVVDEQPLTASLQLWAEQTAAQSGERPYNPDARSGFYSAWMSRVTRTEVTVTSVEAPPALIGHSQGLWRGCGHVCCVCSHRGVGVGGSHITDLHVMGGPWIHVSSVFLSWLDSWFNLSHFD